MNVKNINKIDRPREKLIYNGANNLTDSELLAIMLDTGTKELGVLELSSLLINDIGLKGLLNISYNDLSKYKGIKMRKASKLIACFEIAKRCIKENNDKLLIKDAKDVYEFLKGDYLFKGVERLIIIYVNNALKIIKKTIFDSFEVGKTALPIKQIIKEAINYNAAGIFVSHNHPSGNPNPSRSDIFATASLYKTLMSINIILFDHVISVDDSYFSFEEEGIMKKIENGEITLL